MNLPNAAYPLARRIVHRHFILIGLKEVPRDKPLKCQTVLGSRSMHSIRSVSHTNNILLECHDHSYFCPYFALGALGTCPHRTHVEPWKMETLQSIISKDVVQEPEEEDPDWEKELDENLIAAALSVGDHFAVLADPLDLGGNGADFFVLNCTKKMHLEQAERVTDN